LKEIATLDWRTINEDLRAIELNEWLEECIHDVLQRSSEEWRRVRIQRTDSAVQERGVNRAKIIESRRSRVQSVSVVRRAVVPPGEDGVHIQHDVHVDKHFLQREWEGVPEKVIREHVQAEEIKAVRHAGLFVRVAAIDEHSGWKRRFGKCGENTRGDEGERRVLLNALLNAQGPKLTPTSSVEESTAELIEYPRKLIKESLVE